MANAKQTTVAATSGCFTLSSRQSGVRHVANGSSEWPMDDIDQGLAATFEGSLSGLGVDLSSSAFNMSDAIMSLSPCGGGGGGRFVSSEGSESSNFSVLERHLDLTSLAKGGAGGSSRFSFVLSAGTSPAVKVNEEPLTYLNQGQPYEVKMAYNSPDDKPRLLKSILRVSFHERRMQFMEKEHLDYWRQSRPCERILDVDAALSYNARQVSAVPSRINVAEVLWEGGGCVGGSGGGGGSSGPSSAGGGGSGSSSGRQNTADCGAFVKLHCISTEFTARKHGGEKGIPFRLQIDTFDSDTGDHLCSVAAQVKVFKPKGADRKQKTDREKVERRSAAERTKYQAALPYTPFLALCLLADGEVAIGAGAAAAVVAAAPVQPRGVAAFSIGGDAPQVAQQTQLLQRAPVSV